MEIVVTPISEFTDEIFDAVVPSNEFGDDIGQCPTKIAWVKMVQLVLDTDVRIRIDGVEYGEPGRACQIVVIVNALAQKLNSKGRIERRRHAICPFGWRTK